MADENVLASKEGGGGGAKRLMRLGNIGPPQRQPVSADEIHRLQREVNALREEREEDQETISMLRADVDVLSHELELLGRQVATLIERERQRVRREENAPGHEGRVDRQRMPADIDVPIQASLPPPPLEPVPQAVTKEEKVSVTSTSLPRLPKILSDKKV